jgi:hypothetical protein
MKRKLVFAALIGTMMTSVVFSIIGVLAAWNPFANG